MSKSSPNNCSKKSNEKSKENKLSKQIIQKKCPEKSSFLHIINAAKWANLFSFFYHWHCKTFISTFVRRTNEKKFLISFSLSQCMRVLLKVATYQKVFWFLSHCQEMVPNHWAENLNFPPLNSKQLIQIFCSGEWFGTFCWQWDQR